MKNFFILFLIFCFVIVAFEIFLRYSPFSNGVSPVLYDKDIGMWHKKRFNGYIGKECYQNQYSFDEFGRVSNNYPYDKSKKDIILLGDSQIEALMVPTESVIHNSLYNAIDGKYNVLNYGLSGTGPAQHYQILKHKVDLSNTDMIIHFIFLENDLNDADPNNFSIENRPKVYMKFSNTDTAELIKPKEYDNKEKIRDFLGNLELYTYLKKNFYYCSSLLKDNTKVGLSPKHIGYNLKNEEYKWKQIQGSVYQINKMAKKRNIKYQIIIYSTYEFNHNYDKKRKQFEQFLNNNKIESINVVPFLKNLSLKQKIDFECDGHWNRNTHREIANYIEQEIFQ